MIHLQMAQLMPQPLTVSCFSKIQICFTFLVLAHPGRPGQRATKWVCVCTVYIMFLNFASVKVYSINNLTTTTTATLTSQYISPGPAMSIGWGRSDLCTEPAAPCTYNIHTVATFCVRNHTLTAVNLLTRLRLRCHIWTINKHLTTAWRQLKATEHWLPQWCRIVLNNDVIAEKFVLVGLTQNQSLDRRSS